MAQSMMSNNSRKVWLLQDTRMRMAFWFYAMNSPLHLKQQLLVTIHKSKFRDLELNEHQRLVVVDKDDIYSKEQYAFYFVECSLSLCATVSQILFNHIPALSNSNCYSQSCTNPSKEITLNYKIFKLFPAIIIIWSECKDFHEKLAHVHVLHCK